MSSLCRSTKTYGHEEGLSCTFRQWRAGSHCSKLHGYAFKFSFTFEGEADDMGWVVDFGSLKPLRKWLHAMFDHTLLVAVDDPERERLAALAEAGMADVIVVEATGCEAMARMALGEAGRIVGAITGGRCRVVSVEVWEHPGNSAIAVA